MWNPNGAEIVLWLHVLGACVWIGGQVTIAALIPMLRGEPLLMRAAANRYQWIAWSGFAVLIITGIFNARNADISWGHLDATSAGKTLEIKLLFVLLSGLAAAVHAFIVAPRASVSRTRLNAALSAILGTASLLFAGIAALYGVVIAEH
jgi:putative copper export protein